MSEAPAPHFQSQAVTRTVVRAQSPEEREYERRLAEIAARKRRIAAVEVELAALKGALARFEALCHARVGDLLAELRRIERAAADYAGRLERLRSARDRPVEEIDEEEPGPFAWREEGMPGNGARDRAARPPRRRSPRRLGEADEAEVKRLYLDLAKRCHPDYAQDDAERRRREEVMQRVNEAFRARDLAGLRALSREAEADDPAFATRPVRERLAWALAELARLDALLAELKAEFTLLRGSEAHRLWRRHEVGESVFEGLEDSLEQRLAAEGRRLDGLIAAYREARDERQRTATAAR